MIPAKVVLLANQGVQVDLGEHKEDEKAYATSMENIFIATRRMEIKKVF